VASPPHDKPTIVWDQATLEQLAVIYEKRCVRLKALCKELWTTTYPAVPSPQPETHECADGLALWEPNKNGGTFRLRVAADDDNKWTAQSPYTKPLFEERCHGEPRLILLVFRAVDEAITWCEQELTERQELARERLKTQQSELLELQRILVTEQMKG